MTWAVVPKYTRSSENRVLSGSSSSAILPFVVDNMNCTLSEVGSIFVCCSAFEIERIAIFSNLLKHAVECSLSNSLSTMSSSNI